MSKRDIRKPRQSREKERENERLARKIYLNLRNKGVNHGNSMKVVRRKVYD